MPIQQKERYRILSGLLDTSFGKSSERQYPNHFIKMTMPLEGTVVIKSQIIVNIASTNVYNEMRKKYREELLDLISNRLKVITQQYKDAVAKESKLPTRTKQPYVEPAPATVKLTVDSSSIHEWLEHVSMSAYRTNKTCIYHLECVANVNTSPSQELEVSGD